MFLETHAGTGSLDHLTASRGIFHDPPPLHHRDVRAAGRRHGLGISAWHMRKTVTQRPGLHRHASSRASCCRTDRTRHPVRRARDDGTLQAPPPRSLFPPDVSNAPKNFSARSRRMYLDKSSPHVLGPGSEVRSVYLVDPGEAVIDLNSAFADRHRSGVLVEELTVASLIHTISANTPGNPESKNPGRWQRTPDPRRPRGPLRRSTTSPP